MANISNVLYSSQYSSRVQLDGQKSTTMALPIISNTSNTNAIDLEAANPFPSSEQITLIAATGLANANSGNAAVLSFQLQHSNTNVSANFTNVSGTGPVNIASNGANYPATNTYLATPDVLYRYVRLQVTQSAGGANSANAANITFALGF